jgi:hypothetical protein
MGSEKPKTYRRRSSFPTGAFLVVVILVCLGLNERIILCPNATTAMSGTNAILAL